MDGNMKEILLSMAAAIMLTFCGSSTIRAGWPADVMLQRNWWDTTMKKETIGKLLTMPWVISKPTTQSSGNDTSPVPASSDYYRRNSQPRLSSSHNPQMHGEPSPLRPLSSAPVPNTAHPANIQVRIHRRVQSSPLRSRFSNLYSRWVFPFPSEQQHTSLDMKTQYGWSSSIFRPIGNRYIWRQR